MTLEKLQVRAEANTANELVKLLQDAVVQTRDLAYEFVPAQVNRLGLVLALESLAQSTGRLHGVTCSFQFHGGSPNWDDQAAMHLYRIAQEAINNATRHGKPRNILVFLEAADHSISLRVLDDGVGVSESCSEGVGLRIMRYRARSIGGEVTLSDETAPARLSRALSEQILKSMKSRPRKEISVVIVEDHRMFREQLVRLINKTDGMKVCGEADNIRDAFSLIQQLRPSIAIVDITLKGSSGLELLKDLRAQGVAVPALVLSMHDESLYAERALRAGARGYVNKGEDSAGLMRAIRRVLSGEIYLNTSFMSRMVSRMINGRNNGSALPIDRLADRELEVFDLVGRGLTTGQIAAQLGLGVTTVDTYRTRIKEKLNLENSARLRVEASRWVQLREQSLCGT